MAHKKVLNPTVKVMGKRFVLPKWARWIAVDKDGEVVAFEHKPTLGQDPVSGLWFNTEKWFVRDDKPMGDVKELGNVGRDEVKNWKKKLWRIRGV
jgi:hypothetical protein